ncbi:hypothetical protein [Streptomyces iconiensis]|uniref:Tetratricopeptide repeat protein n=1 Tax=Streptomyces iconiensis TaxID=1384038 RepID=A0ABT7AAQ8_9ACTN|nr:hypothetical protein [Streptomyces iconiensis]MDJ1137698.1 hypothetical protein [Streptomyces iconiensis]
MTSPRTSGRIREEIRVRESEPYGQARVAAAGELVAEARASGDRATLVAALNHLAVSCALAARARAALEPVVALLGMWDLNRDDFGEDEALRLHRVLGWLVEGLLDDPGTPLAQVEEWLAETRRRHTEAGHSPLAAHRLEFLVATEAGDRTRAASARTAWLGAGRDAPADCDACERAAWGGARLAEGDEEGALREWRPVLRGELTCPARAYGVHARSLLPLMRLGRTDEARQLHIRGYLLARDEEGARRALADHLVFCALTGNEPRALEILGEQNVRAPHRWLEGEDPGGYGAWTAAVALLTRRLTVLGHGDTPVPGPPGRHWTATTLLDHARSEALAVAARFDRRRRGPESTEARDTCRSLLAAEPLPVPLPLGLGGPELHTHGRPASTGAALTGAALTEAPFTVAASTEAASTQAASAETPSAETPAVETPNREREFADPYALLDEARGLSAVGHPTALAVWARVEDAVERTGTRLTDGERAELLDHRAMELVRTDPAGGAARFTEAAQLHATAGMRGEALACRARAVLAGAFAGQEAQAQADIGPLCEEARRLHAEGRIGTRHATAVLLTRARIGALRVGGAAGEEAARIGTALDAELADLIAFAEPDRAEPAVLARIAEATESRGRLAAQCGESARAGELLTEAATLSRAAGRPWAATGAELALARLLTETGEPAGAAALLRSTLGDGDRAGAHTPGDLTRLHLALADAYAAEGQAQEEAAALRHAAHWAARGGGSGAGVHARLRLGGCLLGLEILDECEAVLASLLPELLGAREESAALQACDWLAQACDRAGRLTEAAEWLLLAAGSAHEWEDRHGHAAVAHLAADALRGSGQYARAEEAYARAEQVWRGLGDIHAVLRTLHARAWLAAEAQRPVDDTLAFMAAAHREIEAARESPLRENGDGRPDERPDERLDEGLDEGLDERPDERLGEREDLLLRLQTGHTHRQTAEILAERADRTDTAAHTRALGYADRAVEAFRACGEDGLHEATGTELFAAALETGLDRHVAALARTARVRALYPFGTPDPDGTVAERLKEAERVENRATLPRS